MRINNLLTSTGEKAIHAARICGKAILYPFEVDAPQDRAKTIHNAARFVFLLLATKTVSYGVGVPSLIEKLALPETIARSTASICEGFFFFTTLFFLEFTVNIFFFTFLYQRLSIFRHDLV